MAPSARMIDVFADPAALARGAALLVRESAREALGRRGQFLLVLAGGSTPRALYRELAAQEDAPDWNRTLLLFGDERCVPPEHARSNYRMCREALLDPAGVPDARVLRIEGELEPAAAASRYETRLRGIFPDAVAAFDLVLLGVGADGHTASLFRGTAALDERARWVAANWVPGPAEWRLTLTLPALAAARRIAFLAAGSDKARVVAEAFGGAPHEAVHPAELVARAGADVRVLCDAAAGALVTPR